MVLLLGLGVWLLEHREGRCLALVCQVILRPVFHIDLLTEDGQALDAILQVLVLPVTDRVCGLIMSVAAGSIERGSLGPCAIMAIA